MNIPAFCIRRPAFTIVISLVLIIIGLIGYMNLPIRWIPNVSLPQVTIMTPYPGANARLVEHDVTKAIEDVLSGINGIEMLTSVSRQGESQISLTFKLGVNMDAAVADVRSSVERVRGFLPKDAKTPIVVKADPNEMPVLFISFYNPNFDARTLSDYIEKYVVPSFETIDGVGSVMIYGKRTSAMRIWLDPAKLASAKIAVDEVTQLLQEQNLSIPSGQIRATDRFYGVVTDTTLKTPEQFNELILRDNQNQVVRLKDVAEVNWGVENKDSAFRVNGKSAIALGIIPQSIANPLEVEQRAQKVLTELQRTLPAGMKFSVDYNQADYIRASMYSVYESFIEAVLFVWLVIFLFLGNLRATFIPIVTIPVCLLSTFAILYFFNFSINTITLMAFVLAIGLVVDDAIVVLENISRYMEKGLSAFAAALKGSKEIVFPIIAMTLTLATVYAPIAFTSGLLGVLFREFTFTLAGSVIISGIVALTLSPMMCARILKNTHDNRYSHWLSEKIIFMQNRYEQLLRLVLNKKIWVLGFLAIFVLIGIIVFKFLPSELAPAEDMNEIYVFSSGPRSASFQYTDSYAKQLEAMYAQNPDIKTYFSIVGHGSPTHAFQILDLKKKSERSQPLTKIVENLTQQTNTISGLRTNVIMPPPALAEFAGSDEGDEIGLVIMTSSDYRQLQQVVQRMVSAIRDYPGFAHVENRLKWDSSQFQINIDRDKAADIKIPLTTISNTISTLLAGKNIGKTDDANIIVQMNENSLSDANIFQQLYTRNLAGEMIPLSQVLSVNEITTPEVFHHFNRLRSDTIYITLSPDFKLAEAIKVLQTIAQQTLPDNMKYTFSGMAKSYLESSGKTAFTFLLALVFIYLVLVAQFESFIDPLIILFTVPFAMIGAFITLKLFGGSLNIYSNIGLITLVGLIAKHGILITDFANRLRREGQSIQEAIINSAILRLRPIFMTTAAMFLGALPLAFAFGPGAESRQQIGLVITGGLLFGTFFSLIVIPIVYTYLAPLHKLSLTANQEDEYATVL